MNFPVCIESPVDSVKPKPSAVTTVGAFLRDYSEGIELANLSDDALHAHITHCGIQMLAADKLGMKDERRRWLSAQEAALRERHRRPQIVAEMEHGMGLA